MWRVSCSVAGPVLTQANKDALGLVVAHALSISPAEQASEPSFFLSLLGDVVKYTCTL